MDACFKKIKDEIDDDREARQFAWDEYRKRCAETGAPPDKQAFIFAFNAGLAYGQFTPMDDDIPLDT